MTDDPSVSTSPDEELPEPAPLRRLRYLVTALTLVLIVGVVTIVGALVIRIAQPSGTGAAVAAAGTDGIALPGGFDLPEDARAISVGLAGRDWVVVMTLSDGRQRVAVFSADGGAPVQTVDLP